MKITAIACAAAAGLASAGAVSASTLTITVENLAPAGGFSLTPVWMGFQNGSFETFTPGMATTAPGITEIAELGDTGPITNRFAMQQPNGTDFTFADPNGAPVFSPGESASTSVNVASPDTYRFLSFASMVVPTNDLFVGNSTPLEVFDAMGGFNGPIVIELFGADVYDNGSEVNDVSNGPAFVMGQDAMAGADENGVARLFFNGDPGNDMTSAAYLQSIVGVTTPVGVVSETFDAQTPLARITIVPSPGPAGALALAGLAAVRRRR